MGSRRWIGLALGAIGCFAAGAGARASWEKMNERPAAAATIAPERAAPERAAPKRTAADSAVRTAAVSAVSPAPPPARTEHAVWKLVDNRHTAHRLVGDDLVIDASGAGFARYVRFGVPAPRWRFARLVDGERAAVAERRAPLEIPLTAEQAQRATHVLLRVHGRRGQSIALRFGGKTGKTGARTELAGGWQTVALPVPESALAAGENQLAIEPGGALAVAWLRIGATATAASDDDPRTAAAFDPAADAIALADGASLVWYVTVPDTGHLVGRVTGDCTVDVRARTTDGALAGGALSAGSGRVDLSSLAGRVVALGLTARGCPRAAIAAPHIALRGPAPAVRPPAAPPRFVVLWVMDTLRALSVPLFTPGARAQTPHLDELAKTSAVFRQYYVQGNESQTSHSTVWTGLYPAVHQVRLAGEGGAHRIDDKLAILAKQLRTAGFATMATTANGFINEWGGYTRGFAEYRNLMREPGVKAGVVYGERVVSTALAQLDRHRTGPAYLFLGTVDSHAPWIVRRPWIDLYSPRSYDGPFQDFATAKVLGLRAGSMGCAVVPPQREIDRLVAIYDSTISYQDAQLGRFIGQLREWGIWDETMLILTADHGEELFEYKQCGHGASTRDLLVRVPLLIHDPARFPGGTIVDEGAEGVDVLPTVLDAIGAPAVPAAQGRSLAPLAQGVGRGWPQPSYTSMYEYAHAMRIGRWKIRVGASGAPLVHDMVADPIERTNLADTRAVERRMLTDHIGLFLASRTVWKKSAWGVTTNMTAAGAAALDEPRGSADAPP